MTLEDLLHLTRRRIGSLVLALVVCVLASMLFAFASPSTYTATSQAYLRVKVAGDPVQSTLSQYNAAQLAAMKADAVVPVFTSAAVAQRVVDSLKLDETAEEFASSVSATRVPETVSVQVSATASSSHRAQVLADEVVRQASVEIKDLEGEDSPVEIVLLSSAELVSATRSPALVTCMAVGLLAGLVLGYVWILVQELHDNSLKGPEEVREARGPYQRAPCVVSGWPASHGRHLGWSAGGDVGDRCQPGAGSGSVWASGCPNRRRFACAQYNRATGQSRARRRSDWLGVPR